jgi:acyl-coenzyme A synthetase/AMP-(fatty) acid ligase
LGLAKTGVIGAPIVPGSAALEITHIVNDLGAKFLICQASYAPAVEEAAEDLKTV